ncbi:MAG: hybrid sensor histidine kinase/response regulator, partial [Verrucomicrobia bacterium]
DAATGTAALTLWQEHKSRIQLLLTDIVMPEGMTGLDLAQRLQAEKAGLKVIYSSGYSTDAITRDLKFSEKANFVQKPYTPRKLARIVRDCLDGEL